MITISSVARSSYNTTAVTTTDVQFVPCSVLVLRNYKLGARFVISSRRGDQSLICYLSFCLIIPPQVSQCQLSIYYMLIPVLVCACVQRQTGTVFAIGRSIYKTNFLEKFRTVFYKKSLSKFYKDKASALQGNLLSRGENLLKWVIKKKTTAF